MSYDIARFFKPCLDYGAQTTLISFEKKEICVLYSIIRYQHNF